MANCSIRPPCGSWIEGNFLTSIKLTNIKMVNLLLGPPPPMKKYRPFGAKKIESGKWLLLTPILRKWKIPLNFFNLSHIKEYFKKIRMTIREFAEKCIIHSFWFKMSNRKLCFLTNSLILLHYQPQFAPLVSRCFKNPTFQKQNLI